MSKLTLDDLYLMELKTQCEYANFALIDASKYINNKDIRRFWYSLQSFLISVANISKILWPQRKKFNKRGAKLREVLDIENDSPLKPRDFRNHFEHYDERIQEWFESDRPEGFADFNIGGNNSFGGGLGKSHYMRNFNPETETLYFRGEHYEFKPVISALNKLLEKLNKISV